MCKLSLLFIEFCLFVILVSLMLDIKRQSVFFFFCLFPNFVYSVIINQSRCTTAFRTQTDTKDMWGDWDGKKRKKRGKERGRWKNGCHRNSKFFLKLPRGERREREREKRIGCVSRLRDNWACACVLTCVYRGLCSWATIPNSLCDWQLYSRSALWVSWSWLLGLYLREYTGRKKSDCS